MSLMNCPECGKEISDRAASCPNCGYPISPEPQPPNERIVSPDHVAFQYNPIQKVVNEPAREEIGHLEQPKKRHKLKGWQKALIGIGAFVFVLAILFVILILIPAIRSVNSYEEISPYLNYVGISHPDEDETITLTEEEYNNIDDVEIWGLRGEVSFNLGDGYISSCTWTSFDFCSEEEYRALAKDLYLLFESEPDIEAESYGNGNTYRYSWTDPYYGFTVTMAHGFFSYDPNGKIEIMWETTEDACDIVGHTWIDATCLDPKTCAICNATEGEASGHQVGEWGEWDIDYDEAVNARVSSCTLCEEIVETQEAPIASFINGKCFSIYPYAFAKRFENASSRLNDIDYSTKSEYEYDFPSLDEENYIYYRIQDKKDDYADIGLISFSAPNGNTIASANDFTEDSFNCINILIEDSYDVSAVVYATILAIDPGIGYSEAADIGQTVVDNLTTAVDSVDEEVFQGIEHNDINYLLYKDSAYHYLIVTIAD